MSRSEFGSIDSFLEANPEHADLGRFLIARELKAKEVLGRLFRPHDPGWYRHLFAALIDGGGLESVRGSQISIVTFNYDRSLLVYLREALRNRFPDAEDEVDDALATIPVVHLHGSLGRVPDVPYFPSSDVEELLEISRQIRVVGEIEPTAAGFCTSDFAEAHSLFGKAERILFLGFGFHHESMERFRFFTPETVGERELLATAWGVTPIQRRQLEERLEEFSLAADHLLAHHCNRSFTHAFAFE